MANFRTALTLNRVMVMDDAWSLGLPTQGLVDDTPGGQSKCPNKSAQSPMECYFKPVSRCSLADALQVAGERSLHTMLRNAYAPLRLRHLITFCTRVAARKTYKGASWFVRASQVLLHRGQPQPSGNCLPRRRQRGERQVLPPSASPGVLASDCDRPNRWWSTNGAGCALQHGNRPNYMNNSYWYNELRPMEIKPLIQTQALLHAP